MCECEEPFKEPPDSIKVHRITHRLVKELYIMVFSILLEIVHWGTINSKTINTTQSVLWHFFKYMRVRLIVLDLQVLNGFNVSEVMWPCFLHNPNLIFFSNVTPLKEHHCFMLFLLYIPLINSFRLCFYIILFNNSGII